MVNRRSINVFLGGVVGCAIASFGYLVWYMADDGELSARGTRDMIICMVSVGGGATVGSLIGHIGTGKKLSTEEVVRYWLQQNQTILSLSPEAMAEIKEVVDA
ncbi:MAG: hypothetical protein AAGD25_06595 [Cyanobacteria bacterium P01_F01_bin.150]